MTTKSQLLDWLKSGKATRVILVEITGVLKEDGSSLSVYLSNRPFTSRSTDTPSNISYTAVISGGITFSESLSLDGQPSIGFGDIEIDNRNNTTGGDTWFKYVWSNKPVSILVGDATWPRADFYPIFSGLIRDIDTSGRSSVNLLLVNRLEKLNIAASEVLVGGTVSTKDQLIPLTFGECFNVTPILVDPSNLIYQVHNGPVEDIIEVRDNGAPLSGVVKDLTNGKFRLTSNPFGTVTASVQGYKKSGTTYQSKLGSVISSILLNYLTITPTYSLSASPLSINEGDQVTFTLLTTDVNDNVLIPYTISGVTTADLVGLASLNGNFSISNNQASVTLTTSADLLTEGTESITLTLTNGSGVSSTVTLGDTSLVQFTSAPTQVTEGQATNYTISVDTGNINTILYWTLNFSGLAATSADFTGTFGTLSGGSTSRTFSITPTADFLTDPGETFKIDIRKDSTSGTVLATSNAISIVDASITRAATVTPSTTNTYVEGDTISFGITPNYTGTVYWRITGTSGTVDATDFLEAVSGNFSGTSNTQYTFTRKLLITDGADTTDKFVLQVSFDNTFATIIGTSGEITITNASVSITPSTLSVNESTSRTVTFAIVPNFIGTVYWEIVAVTGNLVAADFSDSSGMSGTFNNITKGATTNIVKTMAVDTLTESVAESFRLDVRAETSTGTLLLSSSTVSVTDDSTTPVVGVVFSTTPASVDENSAASFTITTTNGNTAVLYYEVVLGGAATSADFTGLTALIPTNPSTRTFSITPLADYLKETPAESFQVKIWQDAVTTGTLRATSTSVTITDTSYIEFSNPALTINEGAGQLYTLNVGSVHTSTPFYWKILHGTTVDADFGGVVSGTTTSTNGGLNRTFTVTPTADVIETGNETFQIQILTESTAGTVRLTSSAITISNTSPLPGPSASIAVSPLVSGAANEGTTLTFTVTTTNFGTGTLYYSIDSSATVTINDFSDTTLTGSFSVTNNSGSFTKTIFNDSFTEGTETITLRIKTVSVTGSDIGTTTFNINDTSQTPAVTANVTASPLTSGAANEGTTLTFTVTTTNFGTGTMYYTIDGTNIAQSDFTDNSLSGTISITNNSGTVTKTINPDGVAEGAETFTFRVKSGSINGTELATTSVIINSSTAASTIALVQTSGPFRLNSAGVTTGTFTIPILPTPGNFAFISAQVWQGTPSEISITVTDNQVGNTWKQLKAWNAKGNSVGTFIFYCSNLVRTTSTYTVTITSAIESDCQFIFQELSGVSTTNPIRTSGINSQGAVGTTYTSLTVQTAGSASINDWILGAAAIATGTASNITTPTGYTSSFVEQDDASKPGGQSIRKVATANGVQSATWTGFTAAGQTDAVLMAVLPQGATRTTPAVTFATGVNSTGNITSLAITYPAAAQGDLQRLFVVARSSTVNSPPAVVFGADPSGWTVVNTYSFTTGGGKVIVYGRTVGAGGVSAGSATVSITASGVIAGFGCTITNATAGSITYSLGTSFISTANAPAVTVNADNSIRIQVFACSNYPRKYTEASATTYSQTSVFCTESTGNAGVGINVGYDSVATPSAAASTTWSCINAYGSDSLTEIPMAISLVFEPL